MSGIKFDSTGGTDVLLHYFPLEAVAGMEILVDKDNGSYALDLQIFVGEDPDDPVSGETAAFPVFSSMDSKEVVAFADRLAERIWGQFIDVGKLKEDCLKEAVP